MVHLAGCFIRIGPWCIQRCIICGYELIKTDLRRIAVPDGQSIEPGRWLTGDLVEVDESEGCTRSVKIGELPEDFQYPQDIPADFCLSLVEE